ncbi:MAG TPA: hypothetical protein DCF73_07130, partial [Rhodobiaceae bacterium]|nr:hypothetical protein [Rhodobiaceae bacterium]
MSRTFPFFIVGSVRSGTTLLREILKSIHGLECPEETHFYRWGHPFGSGGYYKSAIKSPVLRRHREIDGVEESNFVRIIQTATSRRDLQALYAEKFMTAKGTGGRRWFDKTPQNVYGLPLLAHDFPEARFVHIVRNPLNVAASLVLGKVIKAPNIISAANYWQEAIAIFNTVRPIIKTRTYELKYEDLTASPQTTMTSLLNFL